MHSISKPSQPPSQKTMTMNTLPALVTFYLPWFIILTLAFLKLKNKSRVNLPPSPPKLPIIGNLHQVGKLPHQSLWKLAQNHGPIMLLKLGCNSTLVISSAALAREVLKTQDLNFCSRPHSTGAKKLSYDFLDVAFAPYGDHSKDMRKLFVSELLSSKRSQLFQAAREDEINNMINSLYSLPMTPVNLDEKFCDMLDEIVCVVAFGKSYRGEKYKGKNLKEVIEEAMVMLEGFSYEDFFPRIGWILDLVSGQRRRLENCSREIDGYFQMVLDDHLDQTTSKPDKDQDFADSMIERLNKDQLIGNIRLTKNHIKASFLNTTLGGVDTVSVTIVWAMSELIKNPRVMQKLQAEIRHLVGKKHCKVQVDDLQKFTYLKMVVKETLRLHPPAPFLIPHESIGHCKIDRYDVFPKTTVLVNAWGIGRDPVSWENPHEFFPERFEDNDIDFKGQHFELLPFGAGRRLCPGVNMAILTIDLTLANLLCNFDWEVPSGMKIEDVCMEENNGLVIHRKTPLCLVPIPHKWQED